MGAFLFLDAEPSEGQSLNLEHLSRLGEPIPASERPQDAIVAPSSEADALVSTAPEQPVPPEPESRREKIVKETQRGLDRTRDRLENEVFTDEEERERFEKNIKEAIERLESDKLREFIERHNAYNADYLQWNQDFCDLLGLKTAEGKALGHPERRKFVAATQLYLGSHFQDRAKDIFRVRKKDINPFTYIDGRMGAYTVSVLAAYWNEKNPKDKRGLVEYSDLGETFRKKGDNQKVYGEALKYLKGQLAGAPVSLSSAPSALPNTDSIKAFVDNFQSHLAQLGNELKLSINTHTEVFVRFVALMGKEHPAQSVDYDTFKDTYLRAMKSPVSSESVATIAVSEAPVSPERGAEIPFPPSVESLIDDSLQMRKKNRSFETGYHQGLQDKMLRSLAELRAEGSDIWFNSIKDAAEGSWPRQAFDAYSLQYKDWKEAEANYNKIKGLSTIDPAELSRQEAMVKSKVEAVQKALDTVEVAINEYFAEEDRILDRLRAELVRRAKAEFQLYDFPEKVDFSRDPQAYGLAKSASSLNKGLAYGIQWSQPTFFETYFTAVPTRIFKSDADMRKAIKKDKAIELGTMLQRFRTADLADYQAVNNAIYIRNINALSSKLYNWFGMKHFVQEERNKAYARPLDSLSSPSEPQPNPDLLASTPGRR